MEAIKLIITLGIAIATNAHSVVLLVKEVRKFFRKKTDEKDKTE